MNIIAWIVLGGIAGWIASLIMDAGGGLLKNIILGIIGALVGGFLMDVLFDAPGVTGFNFYSLVVAAIGAIILIFVGRLFRGDRPTV